MRFSNETKDWLLYMGPWLIAAIMAFLLAFAIAYFGQFN